MTNERNDVRLSRNAATDSESTLTKVLCGGLALFVLGSIAMFLCLINVTSVDIDVVTRELEESTNVGAVVGLIISSLATAAGGLLLAVWVVARGILLAREVTDARERRATVLADQPRDA